MLQFGGLNTSNNLMRLGNSEEVCSNVLVNACAWQWPCYCLCCLKHLILSSPEVLSSMRGQIICHKASGKLKYLRAVKEIRIRFPTNYRLGLQGSLSRILWEKIRTPLEGSASITTHSDPSSYLGAGLHSSKFHLDFSIESVFALLSTPLYICRLTPCHLEYGCLQTLMDTHDINTVLSLHCMKEPVNETS